MATVKFVINGRIITVNTLFAYKRKVAVSFLANNQKVDIYASFANNYSS